MKSYIDGTGSLLATVARPPSCSTANPTATHEIEIRYLKGLTAECRIQYGSRTFTLNSVRNIDERQIRQVMVVTELQ